MSKGWLKSVRNSFFAGLLVVSPAVISLMILLGIFNWITDKLLPQSLRDDGLTFLYRVVALVAVVALVTLVGWVTRLVIGKQAVLVLEKIISWVPLLNRIYGFMKDVSDTLLGGRKTMFQKVVLVQFPRPGVYSVGFVTSEAEGEAQGKTKERVVCVFIPTTPNPTSGFLVLVPREQLTEMDMSVADGMKMVISGGAVAPPLAR